MVMEVSQEDGPRAQDLYRGCSTCRGQVSTNRGWDYPDEWSGIATDKVIAVALSILLFGKREPLLQNMDVVPVGNRLLSRFFNRDCPSGTKDYEL